MATRSSSVSLVGRGRGMWGSAYFKRAASGRTRCGDSALRLAGRLV